MVQTTVEWAILGYFSSVTIIYLSLMLVSATILPRRMKIVWSTSLNPEPRNTLPVSVLVPAYNESGVIEASTESLLQLNYPEFEVIVINDGSSDNTLDVLIERFSLVETAQAIYRSSAYPNLLVVDKEKGGKADALNLGLNLARYDLVCCVDADSIFLSDALQHTTQPFHDDPRTVACAGAIRIINGCRTEGGRLTRPGISKNILVHLQILEYLRGFSFGRMAWSTVNAVPIVSGAFGLWKKELLTELGGFRTDTICEDVEMTLRLHHEMLRRKQPYRIAFTPYPVCWTEVPEDWQTLARQRRRWQRHIVESSIIHRGIVAKAKQGAVGWLGLPALILVECVSPIFEIGGLIYVAVTFFLGLLSWDALVIFGLLGFLSGLVLSWTSLILDSRSFRAYNGRQTLVLVLVALVENLGYRQLQAAWRLLGIFDHVAGRKRVWSQPIRMGLYLG